MLKFWSSLLIVLIMITVSGAVKALSETSRQPRSQLSVEIHLENTNNWVSAEYKLSKPVNHLDLGFAHDNLELQLTSWKIETPELAFGILDQRIVLHSKDNKPFKTAKIRLYPSEQSLPGQYRSLVRMNADDLILYTGHIHPFTAMGMRVRSRWFGLPDAQTAMNIAKHPAFVYFGSRPPTDLGLLNLSISDDVPVWIENTIKTLAPLVVAKLTEQFDVLPGAKPTLFVRMDQMSDRNGFLFSGDALPGQIMISLQGHSWMKHTPQGKDIIESGTTHELVHLWQSILRPAGEGVPDWLHEGSADALANEVLLAVGRRSIRQIEAIRTTARQTCSQSLVEPLPEAFIKLTGTRLASASYACGHWMALIAGEGLFGKSAFPVMRFWQSYLPISRKSGYDKAMWFNQIISHHPDPKAGAALASDLDLFPKTIWSNPSRKLRTMRERAQLAYKNSRVASPNLSDGTN